MQLPRRKSPWTSAAGDSRRRRRREDVVGGVEEREGGGLRTVRVSGERTVQLPLPALELAGDVAVGAREVGQPDHCQVGLVDRDQGRHQRVGHRGARGHWKQRFDVIESPEHVTLDVLHDVERRARHGERPGTGRAAPARRPASQPAPR